MQGNQYSGGMMLESLFRIGCAWIIREGEVYYLGIKRNNTIYCKFLPLSIREMYELSNPLIDQLMREGYTYTDIKHRLVSLSNDYAIYRHEPQSEETP